MESEEERAIMDRFAELLVTHSSRYEELARNLLTNSEIWFPDGNSISVFRIEDGGVRIRTSNDKGNTFHESRWTLLDGDDAAKLITVAETIAWHEAMESLGY